jgi:hypothetical protein
MGWVESSIEMDLQGELRVGSKSSKRIYSTRKNLVNRKTALLIAIVVLYNYLDTARCGPRTNRVHVRSSIGTCYILFAVESQIKTASFIIPLVLFAFADPLRPCLPISSLGYIDLAFLWPCISYFVRRRTLPFQPSWQQNIFQIAV